MATKSAAKKNTGKLVYGKMREELIDLELERTEQAKGRNLAEMSLVEKADLLHGTNCAYIPVDDQVKCENVCGAISFNGAPRCPFCGDLDPAATPEQLAQVAREDEQIASRAPTQQDFETVAEALARSAEVALKAVAIVAAPEAGELTPLGELDAANQRISELKREVARDYWAIGRELARVYDAQLWKARPGAAGKPAYKSFEQYVVAEQGFRSNQAFNMIKVAKEYSPDLIKRVGFSNLSIVLTAPADAQPDLLDELERENMPYRRLQERVRQEKKKHPKPKAPQGKHGGAREGAGRHRMTVAAVEGVRKLPLFAKPERKLAEGEVLTKRAQRLNDKPIAIERLDNGVVNYYEVVKSASGWSLKVETRREK